MNNDNLNKEEIKEAHNTLHKVLLRIYLNEGFESLKDKIMEPIIVTKHKEIQERICMNWYSFEVLVSMKLSQIIKPEDKIKYNALVAVILDNIKKIVQEEY